MKMVFNDKVVALTIVVIVANLATTSGKLGAVTLIATDDGMLVETDPDTVISGGTASDLNHRYNTGGTLRHEQVVLQFDISSLTGIVSSAALHLTSTRNHTADYELNLFGAFYDDTGDWNETGITWNNSPVHFADDLSLNDESGDYVYDRFDLVPNGDTDTTNMIVRELVGNASAGITFGGDNVDLDDTITFDGSNLNAFLQEAINNGDSKVTLVVATRTVSASQFRVYSKDSAAMDAFKPNLEIETYPWQLTVDRDTGGMTLSTISGPISFLGYSITSQVGALDQSGWKSITDNYDVDGPNLEDSGTLQGTVDNNASWTILTGSGVHTDLSETAFAGSGGTLDVGSPIVLSTAGAWTTFYEEDVKMSLLLSTGEVVDVGVQFVGNDDQTFAIGDFDFNGAVDEEDYATLVAAMPSNLTGMSIIEAYAAGDMNKDLRVNFKDIGLFRAAFDAEQGAGAFDALLASVPEPSTFALFIAGGVVFLGRRRGEVPRGSLRICVFTVVSCLIVATGVPTYAALTSVTNNNSLDINDVYELSLSDLANGELVQIDRTSEFVDLFPTMAGLDYVLTANDDRAAGPGFSVDLTFDEGTILYLSIDARVGDGNTQDGPTLGAGTMDWVVSQGWKDIGFTWAKDDSSNIPYHVYRLATTGTSHTFLEQNDGTSRNMYSIFGGGEISPTLIVNTDTGWVTIKNNTVASLDLNYYEITSSGSLDADGWMSLDEQNLDAVDGPDLGGVAGDSLLEGWDEGGSSDSSALVELFFQGVTTLASVNELNLGHAFVPSSAEDLEFGFSVAGSDSLFLGEVMYINNVLGDMNGDGTVDELDVPPFILALTDRTAYDTAKPGIDADIIGDFDGNSLLDAGDIKAFSEAVAAAASGSTSAVPEPAAALLLLLATCCLGYTGHRHDRPVTN